MASKQCNLCGSKNTKLLFKFSNPHDSIFLKELGFNKTTFDIVKCINCGLIYVGNRVRNLNTIYDVEKYYSRGCSIGGGRGYQDYISHKNSKIKDFGKKLSKIESYGKKGRILDVGCATGFFLYVAKERKWKTFGVELSKYSSNYARDEFGLNVFTGELIDEKLPGGHFDVITMWDVIEHIQDPLSNLKEANRILKDNGLIVISTADVNSLNAVLSKEKWSLFAPPMHLYYFSKKTLKQMLEKTGFDTVELKTGGNVIGEWFPLYKHTSRYLSYVNTFLCLTLNIGDIMTVYAVKKK